MIDFSKSHEFLNTISTSLKEQGITLSDYFIDHICYRVGSMERYEELKKLLSLEHTLLHEALVSNRPIAAFKLKKPILFEGCEIPLLELPAPKPGSNYEEGFEHAEAVIGDSFEDFSAKYPHIEFDWKGAKKAHNPELRIKLGAVAIKFHHLSLEEVIKSEQ